MNGCPPRAYRPVARGYQEGVRVERRWSLTFGKLAGFSCAQPVHNACTKRMYDFVGEGVKVLVGGVAFVRLDMVAVAMVCGDRPPYLLFRNPITIILTRINGSQTTPVSQPTSVK